MEATPPVPDLSATGTEPDGEEPPRLHDPPPAQRRFSPGDGIRLAIGVVLLVVGAFLSTYAEETIGGAEADAVEAFTRLPDRVEEGVVGVARFTATLVPIGGLVLLVAHRRWRLVATLFVATNLSALAFAAMADRLGIREPTAVLDRGSLSPGWLVDADFPTTAYLATAAGLVAAAVPWLSRRWKRALWAWVGVLVLLRVVGSTEPVLDIVLAAAVGVVIGSVVVFLLGSPKPEPTPEELLVGLRDAGLDPAAIDRAAGTDGNLFLVHERSGPVRFVKVRTPDDRSADLLNRVYRAVRFRSSEVERPYSTLKRRVEHEALMLMSANATGANCARPLTIGETDGGSVFLVLEHLEGTPAATLGADGLTDEVLASLWDEVATLHQHRISHRDLDLDNVLVGLGGDVWLTDMDAADLAASERDRARDVAELLVGVALVVGEDRAVESACAALHGEVVARSLPHLQPLALPHAVRRRLKADKGLLERLRAAVVDRTGAEEMRLERLERIPPRTALMIGALALAFYSLLPQFANLGDTIDAFGDARLAWLPALLVASAATYVFATISLIGSVADPVPVGAAARATVASAFTALVGPASTGRMALSLRFLQRAGVDTADASASVALNSAAGLVTHMVLMFGFFAWTGRSGVGGFSIPEANTILLVLTGLVAVVAVAMLAGPIRRRVLEPAVGALRRAARYVRRVVRSPLRVLALLGGSAFITLGYVAALVFAVEAFGGELTVPQIGAAYLGAAAIANVAPTPGGLGALEAALVAALTGFGLGDAQAVSAVLTFRLATYWLPILPGWLTLMWMQRHDEV